MNEKVDIIIIGGGPAGIVSAVNCKKYYPTKKVILIRKNAEVLVPCGIPYIFGTMLEWVEDDLVPSQMLQKIGIEVVIDEVLSIQRDDHRVITEKKHYKFDKLILATGSVPNVPKNIQNHDADGVYYVPKDNVYLSNLYTRLSSAKKIIVVGTGFIGVEIAGELSNSGKQVTLIGSSGLLKHAFDVELSHMMEEQIVNANLDLIKHTRVLKVNTDAENRATGALLDNDQCLECDAIISAIGYSSNAELAKNAGLKMSKFGAVYVDEYMRTDTKDIFAVGDCAEKRHFITRTPINVMLASTATAEARIAIGSLYGINYIKGFQGTINIFSTVIENVCYASAGLTERDAIKQDFDVVCATFEGKDKHPAKLPNAHKQAVKLVAMRRNGVVIGAQVVGGIDSGEMINMLSVIIENKMDIYALLNLQVATHPLLTAAPTSYPIVKAAELIDIAINSCEA